MTPAEMMSPDLAQAAQALRERDEPFAFATIVRTAGATAAKPGAKALLAADGTILHGFLGGGCTRGAVKRAAVAALQSGTPQLVSIAPEDLLAEKGIEVGSAQDGVTFSSNGCPSRGTVDVFVEPCLPMPELVVLGASPVAIALSTLAPQFHWGISDNADTPPTRQRVVIVATQGQGDLKALRAALGSKADYVAFVGSHRKFANLAEALCSEGFCHSDVDRIKAPAGLDIGAVTPEEIALSILAELISVRRKGSPNA